MRGLRQKPAYVKADFSMLEEEELLDIETIGKKLNELLSFIEFFNKKISLTENFDGKIVKVEIPSGQQIRVQHFLGVRPTYRIILNQEGNGVISDIPSGWDDKVVTFSNVGSSTVIANILLLKE